VVDQVDEDQLDDTAAVLRVSRWMPAELRREPRLS
jgi:hypothetical protein